MLVSSLEKYYHYIQKPYYAFEGHRHKMNEFEVNIILRGSLEITCGDTVFCLHAGSAAVWWAGLFHRNRVVSNEDTEFISLHFKSPDMPESPMVSVLSDTDLALVRILDEEALCRFSSAISRDLLEALLLRLEERSEIPKHIPGEHSELYRCAVHIMYESICEPLTLADIAKRAGVCTTLLKNAFAECAGKGVKAYFIDLKIERAKELLLAGMHSKTIASMLGFSSPAYFSSCFKREVGISARDFIKSHSPR